MSQSLNKKTASELGEVMATARGLVKSRELFEKNEYARSNQRLYEILTDVYKLYQWAKKSPTVYKHTIEQMRDELKSEGNRVQGNTVAISLFVRYVFRTDRQRSYNYSRTLQAAIQAEIAPEQLTEFINKKGGVEECKKAYKKPDSLVAKAKKVEEAMPTVIERLEDAAQNPIAKLKVPPTFVKDIYQKEMIFLVAKTDKSGNVAVMSAVPGFTKGMSKWAKEKLAVFLFDQQAEQQKHVNTKRKATAIETVVKGAANKSAESETIEEALAV